MFQTCPVKIAKMLAHSTPDEFTARTPGHPS
jgi:hypothetical protein